MVHVETSTLSEIRTTSNLIAETKTGRTDRVVVVGAHLDSVTVGPGINDNGSGSSTILEIAQEMAELGIEPRNQVRFAWWGAEEPGLFGSQFYVDQLSKSEIKDIAVNLNFDMVGSPNYVRFVYDGDASDTDSLGSSGSGAVEDVFLDYFTADRVAGGADRLRRSFRLRRLHQRRHPGGRPVHGRRGDQRRQSRRRSTAAPPVSP